MGEYIIEGNKRLKGTVSINGSKNAVLPILAATLLNGNLNILNNCPSISDTQTAIKILRHLGCTVDVSEKTLLINSADVTDVKIPVELIKKMRSSIIFMGALLARFKKALITYPGGCELGKRPIDLHLNAFKKMGVSIEEENNMINCTCEKLKGANIYLRFPSVGATENIILAAVLADGVTTISNSAKEPEIIDLCNFLIESGAKIEGIGTSKIRITGVKKLKPVNYKIMSDRIEAGTYLIMTAATGGKITLTNVTPTHLEPIIEILTKMGCKIKTTPTTIKLKSNGSLVNIPYIETSAYPGIPTDLQPQLTVLSAISKGICHFNETIFESRTAHIPELIKMGADIKLKNNHEFIVYGASSLSGKELISKDLRGGAALIIAGLCAKGIAIVKNSYYVERGYENIVENLLNLGANITLKN